MQEVGSLLMADGVLLGGTFCHQDQYVALLASNIRGNQAANTSTTAGKLHVIDWQDTRRRWTVAFPSEPRSVVAHPHRDELAILRADGKVAIIKIKDDDLEVGRNWSAQPAFHASNFYTNNGQLAYSPDGEQLVVHGSDQRARVYDSQSGKRLYEVEHGGRVNGATFSPSGRWLATAGWGDNRVRIVDAKTGEPAAEDLLHPEWTFTTEFDPTERFLLTTCRDGTVRLWDWRTGQQVAKPMNHAHEVHDARFVRQGNWVVTVCDDASVRIWDARSGDAISPPLRLSDHPYDLALTIAVTPDERHVVIGGPAYRLAVVSLDPSTWPAASTSVAPQPYAELLAGREMREATESQLLTTDWLRRFTDVRQASLLAPPREPSMAVARYRDAAHQELIWGERARTHAVVWNLRRQLAEGLPFDNLNSISRLVPLFTESPEGFKEELRTMVIESLTPDVLQERDWDEAFSDIESALVLGTTWPECPPSQAEIMTQFLEQAPATETSDKRSLHWWFALLRLRSQGPQAALDSLHAARRADSSMSVPRAEDLVVAALAHAKLGNFQTAREWLHLAWAVTRSEVFREPYVDLHRETISVFDNAKEPTGLTRLFPLDQPLAGEETLRSLFPHESISSLDYAAQGEFWLVAQQETVAQDYLEQALKAPSQPLRGLLFAPAQPTVQAASLYLQLYTLHHAQEREQVAKVRQSLRNVYDDFPAPVQLAMVWPLIVTAPQGDTDTWLMTRVATTYEQAEWPDFRLAFAFLLMRQGRSADAIQEFELFEEVMKDPAVSDASRVFVQPELITLGKALALLDLRQVEKAHQMFSDLEARNQDPLNFQTTTGRHFPLFFTARLAMQAFRKELQQRLTLESP
jgi:tetratricopeptide (TPR) repeat protein